MKPQKFKQTEIGKLPENWELKKIKEVVETIFSGGTPDTRQEEFWDGDIFWLSSGETGNKFIFKTNKKITKAGVENSSTRLAKKGDVVIASAGQGYTRGQAALCMIDTYINQSIIALRSNPKKLAYLFLFYNLSLRYKELRNISDSNSSRGSLTTKLIGEMNISFPKNIPEQQAITDILSKLDAKIELNNKMNKSLEAIGQTIFKRWFVDFEFPNEKGKLYKSSGGKMIESELGTIPEGWKISKIGSELKTVLGGTPDRTKPEYWNGNINWINSGKVNEFRITSSSEKITQEGLDKSATKILPKHTTVLAITGATLGQVSRLEIDTCANQSVIGIIENEKIPSEFIYLLIKEEIENIISHQTGGAQQHINKNNVDNYEFLLPPNNLLEDYKRRVSPMFKQIAKNCFENQTLAQIRDFLLPKLMSGEIRVPLKDGK